ncbi:MAG: dCMP deaminase family protein [Clostridia bacterium]|nr:dCMP deaminase family protein [Clostridia bacterium]
MIEERKLQYDQTYMNMAIVLSGLSYANRSKVGCIIVSKENQIISQGFNGMPTGMDNNCEFIDENGNITTKREVLHAETNAIAKCAKWRTSSENATIYVTLSPCFDCAKLIIQSEIKRVVYHDEYRDLSGIKLLIKAGVKVQRLVQMPNNTVALVNVDDEYFKMLEYHKNNDKKK